MRRRRGQLDWLPLVALLIAAGCDDGGQHAGPSPDAFVTVQNRAPRVRFDGPQLALRGTTLLVDVEVDDEDGDATGLQAPQLGQLSEGPRAAPQWSYECPTSTKTSVWLSASDGSLSSSASFSLEVLERAPHPSVIAAEPPTGPGSKAWSIQLSGQNFIYGAQVVFDGIVVSSRVRSMDLIEAHLPPRPRGVYSLTVNQEGDVSESLLLWVANSSVVFTGTTQHKLQEEILWSITIEAFDVEGDAFRVLPIELPPGARFDAKQKRLFFTPDFIQGGQVHTARFAAFDGTDQSEVSLHLSVADTISPPAPEVTQTIEQTLIQQLVLRQTSDNYLDASQNAGRTFEARMTIPKHQDKVPVRVYLHGFGGAPFRGGADDAFRIYPHDPDNTYWWGYGSQGRTVKPYTARRVLHLLEWLLKSYPHADADRVYLHGSSMGGAGAVQIAAHWPRHFAFAESFLGQTIANFHRPSRKEQLQSHWGDPVTSPTWKQLDLSRQLRLSAEARNQWFFFRHAMDDPIIHFDAAIRASSLTGLSVYESLAEYRVGHIAVWDEGGHGPPDPILGERWWKRGEPAATPIIMLSRKEPFIAFTNSELDTRHRSLSEPLLDPEDGNAGQVEVAGDSHYGPPMAGGRGRFFSWDRHRVGDEFDSFELPLCLLSGGQAAPAPGYPSTGRGYPTATEAAVDVTIRRAQRFRLNPKEAVVFSFRGTTGSARADDDGVVTVPHLSLRTACDTLSLRREQPLLHGANE